MYYSVSKLDEQNFNLVQRRAFQLQQRQLQ